MPQGWIDIAPELWPWMLIGGGLVALGAIVLLVTLIVRQRGPGDARATHLTPAQQRTLERDVSNLITALSEMAQAVGGELDERSLRLEKLLAAADERIRRLEELSNGHHIAPAEPATVPIANDPRHAEIYTLADQGLSTIDIAKHLRQPKGEVELILALRPRRAG